MELNNQNNDDLELEKITRFEELKNLGIHLDSALLDYTNGGDLENEKLRSMTIRSHIFHQIRKYATELGRSSSIDETIKSAHALIAAWRIFNDANEALTQDTNFSDGLRKYIHKEIAKIDRLSSNIIEGLPFRINNFVKKERDRFEALIGNLEGDFTTKSIELERKLSEAEIRIDRLNGQYSDELEKADELFGNAKTKLDNHLSKIEEFMGVVTDRGLTSDFNKRAEEEGQTADLFQIAAITIMIAIGVFAVYLLYTTLEQNISLGQAIIKALTLIILSAIPAYLAKEAGRHRNYQYHFRQTALDISALPPYLARVNENDAEKILLEMAPKLFTRHAQLPGHSDNDFGFRDLLLKLLEKFPNKS